MNTKHPQRWLDQFETDCIFATRTLLDVGAFPMMCVIHHPTPGKKTVAQPRQDLIDKESVYTFMRLIAASIEAPAVTVGCGTFPSSQTKLPRRTSNAHDPSRHRPSRLIGSKDCLSRWPIATIAATAS
jgi:hypothetical protein